MRAFFWSFVMERQIQEALAYIHSYEDRDSWIRMGAAIKSELGDVGFGLWDDWSKQASNYDAKEAKQTWKSLKPGIINIGSLFYEAKQGGFQWRRDLRQKLSPEERAKRQEEMRLRRQAEIRAEKKAKQEAIVDANQRWEKASTANTQHPYLIAKGINTPQIAHKLRQEGDNLLIPLKQFGKVMGVQTITPEGTKHFNKNATVGGSSFILGSWRNAQENGVILCEGLATGASIHLATGKTVIVCFSGNNLAKVAQKLSNQNINVVIAADKDQSNQGVRYAANAQAILGDKATTVIPPFTAEELSQSNPPSDFNDLEKLHGREALANFFHTIFQDFENPKNDLEQENDLIIS